MADPEIDFDEALTSLKGMFPLIDDEIIQDMLGKFNNFHSIVDKLVEMSSQEPTDAQDPFDSEEGYGQNFEELEENKMNRPAYYEEPNSQTPYPTSDKERSMQQSSDYGNIDWANTTDVSKKTQPFDPFNFGDDQEDDDDEEEKEELLMLEEKKLLEEHLRDLANVIKDKTFHVKKRLNEERNQLKSYWLENPKSKKKSISKIKFKNETSDGEEIFRFIYNS